MFGGALPRVVLVLYLRFVSVRLPSFLPSSPAPPVSFGLVVVLSPRWAPPLRVSWLSHPTMVHCGFVFCCLSNLAYPSIVVVLFSSSVFVSSSACLRRLCSLVPSQLGHPGLGQVLVLVSSTRSERRLSLLVSFVFLRDGVSLWVKCVFHSP